MASSDVQRKLTAILCADVVGYSRLMGADEEATIETLTAYRKVFLSHIESHRGRVVDAKGDAILAEFASVVDAVSSAVEIQRELAEHNDELSDDRRMDFRVGINLGDVVVKDDAIYGDGVNIAARLEALAEPGGVCISRPVFDQVESKLAYHYKYMGEQRVKNIEKPVRAYQVLSVPVAAAQPVMQAKEAAEPKPEVAALKKLSIAVLPFENFSGDEEQEYFSDGISEDLITALSNISRLSVVSRNTAFSFKGRASNLKQLGQDLGVRYVLEGSVRKAGSRVRITAQLIDVVTDRHLWSQRFDRELRDIFEVQDEITQSIVAALDVTLLDGEQASLWRKTTKNPEAYDLFLKGKGCYRNTLNLKGCAKARTFYDQAISLDPKFTGAIVALAFMYLYEGRFGLTQSPEVSLEKGCRLANEAILLDESLADAHSAIAIYHLLSNDHDQALAEAERAVELAPGSAEVIAHLASIQNYMGHPAKAIETINEAMTQAPSYPVFFKRILGESYLLMSRFEDALEILEESLEGASESVFTHVRLAAVYVALDRGQDAADAVAKVLRLEPDFTLAQWASRALPFKNKEPLAELMDRLRTAGLPE
jgi:TolB-like protein/Tfp pilus assembly protein PilF